VPGLYAAWLAHKDEAMASKIKTKATKALGQIFAIQAPTAMTVQLVGDFTHWQEHPVALKKDSGGVWRTEVELPPGRHHYRFIVDGLWTDDPDCTVRVPNPFGGDNMVRTVG
jgi:1,4-alpha-glucan branching enzyme